VRVTERGGGKHCRKMALYLELEHCSDFDEYFLYRHSSTFTPTFNKRLLSFKEQNRVGSEICLAFLSLVLRIPEAQVAAHGDAGVEGLDAEVHRAVHVAEVRQLDPETVFLNF
jgi:hypothetical protein